MENTQKSFGTSDLMERFNVGRNTLRLYEEMGLLENIKRTEAGYREYSSQHLESLKFIIEAKAAGFTLNEIKDLLDLLHESKRLTCGTVSAEVSAKTKEIDTQISVLINKKSFLQQFLTTCESNGSDSTCNVIQAGFTKKACCGS